MWSRTGPPVTDDRDMARFSKDRSKDNEHMFDDQAEQRSDYPMGGGVYYKGPGPKERGGSYGRGKRFRDMSPNSRRKTDPRYWKDVENRSNDSGDGSPYSKNSRKSGRGKRSKSGSRRRRRSKSDSSRRSRSSSSSSSSSSRSSSSSSRRHSDERSYRSRSRRRSSSASPKRKGYLRNSPSRVQAGHGAPFSRDQEPGWPFPPSHGYSGTANPDSYPPPTHVPTYQGSYPGNFQGGPAPGPASGFNGNYHQYPSSYDSSNNFYPPTASQNFPGSSQPPHEFNGPGGAPNLPPNSNWDVFHDTSIPPPIMSTGPLAGGEPPPGGSDLKTEEAKKEAIEQELLQQKRTLAKQREDYVRRKFSLNRELNRLKDQKRELLKENSKDNERFLRENAKLQNEIQQKLKSIDNVIEMLSNIIGDSARLPEVIKEIKSSEKSKKPEKRRSKYQPRKRSESPPPGVSDMSREPSGSPSREKEKEKLTYYDPGLHWCSECNVFPKSASEYLSHLHTLEHKQKTKLKFEDLPWHLGMDLREKSPPPSGKDYTNKRIPIRGVQFLVPATSWYCSMCKVWLGDMHCATNHVQSKDHTTNYNEFIARNPHWEVDWLTERTRSYEKSSGHVPPQSSSSLSIASLSDQLLAMIAANNKLRDTPPLPHVSSTAPVDRHSSSSSEEEASLDKKEKKKKKSKKMKKEREKSPFIKESTALPGDPIKLNYNKTIAERKPEATSPRDDSFINEWMPRVDKRPLIQIKSKQGKGEEPRSKRAKRRSESPESVGRSSHYSKEDQLYDDHDEAVIFDKRPRGANFEKEKSFRRRYEEDSRHDKYDRHSRYERERDTSKEQQKVQDEKFKYNKFEKHKFDDIKEDLKKARDMKRHRENTGKIPPKSPNLKPKESEKRKAKAKVEKTEEDDPHETSFEKRTSESAAKKKDVKRIQPINLPKAKLPFIGRMPILKKKVEQKVEEKEEKKEESEESELKELIPNPNLPATAGDAVFSADGNKQKIGGLPKSTLIISKRPRLAEPGIVKKEILFNKPVNDNLIEQDMELEEDNSALVVPKEEEQSKDELHKDFKDALDLLFPEEKPKEAEAKEEVKEPEIKEKPVLVPQHPPPSAGGYMMNPGYDMGMYPGYYGQQQQQAAMMQQQWAQMGYHRGEHGGQYPPPPGYMATYPHPPPSQVPVDVPPPLMGPPSAEPKKKKNPPSQRMRRHLQKKKAKEVTEKGDDKDKEVGDEEGDGEEENVGDEEEEGPEEAPPEASTGNTSNLSDLALLGIDEDDAAAQGFY